MSEQMSQLTQSEEEKKEIGSRKSLGEASIDEHEEEFIPLQTVQHLEESARFRNEESNSQDEVLVSS